MQKFKLEPVEFTTQKLVTLSLLVALNVILSRFLSISTTEVKISFSYIPVVIAAIMFGPLCGGLVGGLGDMIGALLFPTGPFFPGFTLCAFLTGYIYGYFCHKKPSAKRIIVSVFISEVLCSLVVNTLWLNLLYGLPYIATFLTRSIQSGTMIVVESITIIVMVKYLPMKRLANLGKV